MYKLLRVYIEFQFLFRCCSNGYLNQLQILMGSDVCTCNFGFAFDDPKFSDRILSIEIISDPVQTYSNGTFSFVCLGDGARMHHEEQTVNSSIPDVGDGMASENQNKNGDAVIEELSSGDEAAWSHDAARSPDFSTALRVKTIHVNSAVLAVKSPFFYKLFSNGMIESEQRVATLRIHASEVAALMELLNFMYNKTLSMATHSSLVDILLIADKFEVASCMEYCIQQLRKLPMTLDFAFSYMERPYSALHVDALRQLTVLVKQFIAVQFRDIDKFKNQVLNLPLAGIEALLSSDNIQVPSEDFLYDLVLKWSELHYPQLEERREVWETHLRHLIRFPYMTSLKLKKVATGTNFSPEVASEIVLEALFFQTGTQYRQRQLASGRQVPNDTTVNTNRNFVERAYILRPVKTIKLELPDRHCVAYLDLKRGECLNLFPSGNIRSQTFQLDDKRLYLSAYCNMDQQNVLQCFGLFLGMEENASASLRVDYEFAAWSKEIKTYKTEFAGSRTVTGETSVGRRNLFNTTWKAFIAEDSPYFTNGKLLIRAVITVKNLTMQSFNNITT